MKKLMLILGISTLAGCSGISQTDKAYVVHAESFNILGAQIPGDAQQRALELIPEGATVDTISSSNSDTTSLLGVLNRIIGIDYVQVGGEKK